MGRLALIKIIYIYIYIYRFYFPTNTQISHNTISLYNVHSNVFRHLFAFFRYFKKIRAWLSYKVLKIKAVNFQVRHPFCAGILKL